MLSLLPSPRTGPARVLRPGRSPSLLAPAHTTYHLYSDRYSCLSLPACAGTSNVPAVTEGGADAALYRRHRRAARPLLSGRRRPCPRVRVRPQSRLRAVTVAMPVLHMLWGMGFRLEDHDLPNGRRSLVYGRAAGSPRSGAAPRLLKAG